ncbi:helix-turn-helix domain-containing protein [Streptomyces aidingensis]|uniref:Putative peptidoglycan binding domain-containing protein n=1 Tax=Streptomyces aidingensis TaxID=910347 RepID=A0A1I1SS78_9ACTN|nr:helix-turn-helix domain-containing protein [Streptomyces aidingensis]SFD46763.1 Putative peptidoglycan binding domain-containing protein [Streptomyces aidingensis]
MGHGRDAELARELRALKESSGLSFEALATRAGISRSALHRYCTGATVPGEFAPVERFARACGAGRERLLALHALWARATGEPPAAPAPEAPRPSAPPAAPDPPGAGRGRRTARNRLRLAAAVAAVLLPAAAALLVSSSAAPEEREPPGLLLTDACAGPVGLGQQGECVREVQRLLDAAGAAGTESHGRYVPNTMRRVLAFQVLAGLRPNGVVDGDTKRALYRGGVSLAAWDKERVAEHIREVFADTPDPEEAVRLADCRSLLDPLYVLSGLRIPRSWGVFQLSEPLIGELGGTLRDALDPAWNIEAAHRLWSRNGDFGELSDCLVSIP